jgi:hypothetical protein
MAAIEALQDFGQIWDGKYRLKAAGGIRFRAAAVRATSVASEPVKHRLIGGRLEPKNMSILNPDGSLAYIIHRVEDATEFRAPPGR